MAYRIEAMLKPPFGAYGEKMALARRALLEGPTEPFSLAMMSAALISVGRLMDALPYALTARELEPMAPMFECSAILLLDAVGRSEEARTLLSDAASRLPADPWLKRAASSVRRSTINAGDRATDDLDPLYAQAERLSPAERDAFFRDVLAPPRALPLSACFAAAHFGCADAAFENLFEALKSGRALQVAEGTRSGLDGAYTTATLFMKDAAGLRRDPRFAQLCNRIGLFEYWEQAHTWPDCVAEVAPHYDLRAAGPSVSRA